MKKEKKKVGRPTTYTKELADLICERLALGESIRTVCKGKDMPAISSVFKWFREHEGFSEQYARAKEESADAMFEDIQDISDEGIDVIKKGAAKKSGALAQIVRLKVDTRKWMMSKMKPKKYGEKLDLTSGDKPLKSNTIVVRSFNKEDEETK